MPKNIDSLGYLASAGSGKTFSLSARYISLLFLGAEPSSILCATFTNKAVSEMKQRIIESLINLERNQPLLEEVSRVTAISKGELLKRQSEILDNFLKSPKFIMTLDSFFSSILRSSSLYIGIEPDFTTKELGDEKREKFFLEEIERASLFDSLVKLSIDIEDRRFLKLFNLMQDFYRIEPILPKKSYSPKSLIEIEREIDSLREEIYIRLKDIGASKRAINNFAKVEVKEFFKKSLFQKESLFEHNYYKKHVAEYPEIEEKFLRLKELLKRWADIKEEIILYNVFTLFDYYKNANIQMARRRNTLSFDDTIYLTYQLLKRHMDRDFLYFKLDSTFKHILLDEFQDTSIVQFLLLEPLLDEIFSGGDDFRTLFYVGDTKQSLYRFRGGREELFFKVAKRYGVDIVQMDTNYRSSKLIVDWINRWFMDKIEGYFPQKSFKEDTLGYVEVINVDEKALIDEVISKVEWLLEKGVEVSDITILVATNRDGNRVREEFFKRGIDSRLKTSSSLRSVPKIASLVRFVEFLLYGAEIDAIPFLERVDKSLDDINLSWFDPFIEPISLLDRLISTFGYFNGDQNILRLLEFASEYRSLESFVEEFWLSSIEVASSRVKGVQIMTIHSSKGLEFPHVVVMDRLATRDPIDRSPFLYSYNSDLYIEDILYRIKNRENFDEEYGDILELQRVLSEKDRLNLLYVALTRGIDTLIVIKRDRGSIFDILDMEENLIDGEIEARERVIEQRGVDGGVELISYGRQEISRREQVLNRDTIFGLAIHYCLEVIEEFSLEFLDSAMVATRGKFHLELDGDDFTDIENRVKSLLQDRWFLELIDGAEELLKEQPISFNGELKQIDLLLDYGDSYLVVDYKSSTLQDYRHHSQVKGYIEALSSISEREVRGVIIYLLKGRLLSVEV